jgi:hypothetical protein
MTRFFKTEAALEPKSTSKAAGGGARSTPAGRGSLNSGIGVLLVLAIVLRRVLLMRTSGIAFVALLFFFLGSPLHSASQTQSSGTAIASQPVRALVRLWGSEQSFGPLVRGELTIDARGDEWRARIAGYEVPVEHTSFDHTNGEIHFALPGQAGKFRGRLHLSANGKRVLGHWIQPTGTAFYNSSGYASPVELSEVSPWVWRGEVVPLDERASFYISIERTSEGSVKAFLRNPEANRFRGQTFDVELKDGAVTLLQKGEVQLQGSYDPQTDVLSLPVVGSYPLAQFTRRDRSNAVGFYPRVPAPSGPYV